MSTTPLTDKALARLKAMADGNGIDASGIKVLKTDEAIYTIQGSVNFTPRFEIGIASPQEMKRQSAISLPSLDALRQQGAGSEPPRGWWDSAYSSVKDLPGKGWGSDAQSIALDEHTKLYAVTESCTACKGKGAFGCNKCDGVGVTACEYCLQYGQPTGEDPRNPGQRCPECQGGLRARCRACNGNGSVQCTACRGNGTKATTYALKLYADTRFSWQPEGEFPSALLRSLDRSGIGRIANGHAKVDSHGFDEASLETPSPFVGYTATLPFATTQFEIGGEKMTAQLLGNKGAILELPPFMDKHLQAAEQSGTLQSLRILREAQIVRARRGNAGDLIRGYPAGLSREMADHLLHLSGKKLQAQTRGPRWQGFGAGVIVATALAWAYFNTQIRNLLAEQITLPFADILWPVLLVALFVYAQRAWVKHALEKHLGQKNLRPKHFTKEAVLGIAIIIAVYATLFWQDAPAWFMLKKLELQTTIEVWMAQ